MLPRRSLAPVVLMAFWCFWTTVVVARPATESEDRVEDVEYDDPAVVTVPVERALADPDSPFNRMLAKRLAAMSDHDLDVLSAGLPAVGPGAPVPEDEMMMGDMPSADDAPTLGTYKPDMTEAQATKMRRESLDSSVIEEKYVNSSTPDKALRLMEIQKQMNVNFNVLMFPRKNATTKTHSDSPIPDISKDALSLLYKSVKSLPDDLNDSYTKKTQSFYSLCNLPKNTNEDFWKSQDSMNMMFNISFPKTNADVYVNVNMAKLWLYKHYKPCYSLTSNESDDSQPCQQTLLDENLNRSNENQSLSAEMMLMLEDRLIRVSIYTYTRVPKRKMVKRKLLDSRMISFYEQKWTEWNIQKAVKMWNQVPNRNFGITIEVEDEDGNLLPVSRFFKPMNCTADAQRTMPKPIPGISLDVVGYNLLRYPMIDVTTVEVPMSEASRAISYQQTKNAVENHLANKAGQTVSEEHRLRHDYRHRDNSTDMIDFSDVGQKLRDRIIAQGIISRNNHANPPPTTGTPD